MRDAGRINSTCATINRHRTGGFQQHLCYMTFTEQCSYKYPPSQISVISTVISTVVSTVVSTVISTVISTRSPPDLHPISS